jgi:hypothetical protein
MFGNAYLKRKDGKTWNIGDFIPKFGESKENKPGVPNVIEGAKNLVMALGDEKAKKRFFTEEELKPILGKDGKRYKYALEERVPERTKPPKRKQRTQFGQKYDKIKSKEAVKPVRMRKAYDD